LAVLIWWTVDALSGLPVGNKLFASLLAVFGIRVVFIKYCSTYVRSRKFFFTIWQQYFDVYKFEIEKKDYSKQLTADRGALLREIIGMIGRVEDLGWEFSEHDRGTKIRRLKYRDIEFHKIIGNGKVGVGA